MQLTPKAFPHVPPHLGGYLVGKKLKCTDRFRLGKMKNSDSKYACKVNLHVKKDGNRSLYDDYRPLNMQTKNDSFPMPLIDDVLS
jgi:hypothetical protein